MATQNPTGEGASITLSVRPCDRAFLRRLFAAARDGLNDELEGFADQLREPTGQLLSEQAAYDQLLHGLGGSPVVPDAAMCEALAALAQTIDRENQYLRVVAEHDALYGLLVQVEEAVA